MQTVVLATRNPHKVGEIQAVLGPGFRYLSLDTFSDAPLVIEDAPTFAGNASQKALALANWLSARNDGVDRTDWWVLADDSGLEVDALEGAPGVHSARFAARDSGRPGNSTDAENNAKLMGLLAGVPATLRTARFHCVIALAPAGFPSPTVRTFDGTCEGRILDTPRGGAGFGYDPLFQPEGFAETFAELGDATKNRISHRARALARLRSEWAPTVEVGASRR